MTIEKMYNKDGLAGYATFGINQDGEHEMVGYKSVLPKANVIGLTEDEDLNKCFRFLANAKVKKYPFIEFKADPEFNAVRVWHKDLGNEYPVFVIEKGYKKSYESILDEDGKKLPCFVVSYWDIEDSNNDQILHRDIDLDNPYKAAWCAIYQVVMADLENTDFNNNY